MNFRWSLLLLTAGWLVSCSPKVEAPPRSLAPTPAPAFSLKDLQGNTITSDSLKGKIVVLHFCASWSPSSAREVRQLAHLQEKYQKKGVQVIGIAMEEGDGSDMRTFATRTPFNYPVVLAPDHFHREFGGIEAIPTTFMISPNWVVMNKHTGMISVEFLEAELDFMIQEAETQGNVLAKAPGT
jgi:peroxiredoxin